MRTKWLRRATAFWSVLPFIVMALFSYHVYADPPTEPPVNVVATLPQCPSGTVRVWSSTAFLGCSNLSDLGNGGGPSAGPGVVGGGGAGAGKPFTSVNTSQSTKKSLDRSPTDCTKKGTSGDTAGDPIEISTQSKIDSITLFAQPGEGGLSYSLNYTSPNGWYDNLGFRLVLNCGNPMPDSGSTCGYVKYYRGDSSIISFTGQAGTVGNYPETDGGGLATLTQNSDYTYTLHDEDGSTKTFDASGRITSIVNSQGIAWAITNDTVGRPTKVTSSNGTSFTIARQSTQVNGTTIWNVTVTDPAGNVYKYSYTPLSPKLFLLNPMQLNSLTLPGSPATTITWKYVSGSFLVSEMDYNGTPYSYATYNSPSASFFPDGATGERLADGTGANSIVYSGFSYTGHSMTATLTNPLGHTTVKQYYWAGEGNPFLLTSNSESAVADCGATLSTIAYDSNGYLSKTVDADGNTHTYSYAANGQLQSETEAYGTAVARTTKYGWDPNAQLNRLTSVTVTGYSKTGYIYNPQNRIASVTRTNLTGIGNANQALTTSYAYTLYGNGMVETMTVTQPSPGGLDHTAYAYDTHGNLTSVTDGLGHATTYSGYNGLGEVGKIVGPNGDETDYTYDARGWVASKTTHPNGTTATWTYGYDGFGLLAKVSAPDGEVTTWSRDAEQRVKTITHNDKDGTSTESFTYDANNDVISDVIARGSDVGKSTSYVYDALGRIYQVKGSNGQALTYAYDGNGNVLSVTDAMNHKTRYAYDALNRVIGVTDAANDITSYTYDAGDHVIGVEDPRGLVTSYEWDGLGQLWQQVSPDTGTTAFQYDTYGRLSYKRLASGMPEYFGYDALNRMVSRGTSEYGSQSFTWDTCTNGKGRLCASNNQGSDSVGYSYSPEGWITGRTFTFSNGTSYSLGYAYDDMGHLSVVGYPDGNQAIYDYSNGAVSAVEVKAGQNYAYAATGTNYRPMDLALSGWTSVNGLTNTIAYDSDLRPTSITVPGIESLAFAYDAANRITGITNGIDSSQSETLGYDPLNRLTTETGGAENESYQYDADGNRTSQVINGIASNFSYPSTSNRLTGVSGGLNGTFGYNANGDIVTVNGLTAYTYDPFERLANTAGTTFMLSADGQRLEKTSASGTTYFAPDQGGGLLAEDQSGTWFDYVYLNGRLVTEIVGGGVFPVHDDQTGRPIAVTDGGSKTYVRWSAENHPFDRTVTAQKLGNFNLGFPGQYHDQEDNLWYNGARDYNSTLGRYMESDPIGLVGGVNTYAYVGNNPVTDIDPLGLCGCKNADQSKMNNPHLNRNMLIGAGSLGVVGLVAINVIGFPEVEGAEAVGAVGVASAGGAGGAAALGSLMDVVAMDAVTSRIFASISGFALGGVPGGALGFAVTPQAPNSQPNCLQGGP